MLLAALEEQLKNEHPVAVVAHSGDYAADLRRLLHRAVDSIEFCSARQDLTRKFHGTEIKVFTDHHVYEV